jgi:lysozyme
MAVLTRQQQKQSRQDEGRVRRPAERQDTHRSRSLPGNQVMQRLLQAKVIQAKLTLSQPDDKYEREADRVAKAVMRMPHNQTLDQSTSATDEERVQRHPIEGEKPLSVRPDVEAQVIGLRGRGKPLSDSTRDFFEPRLGTDLGDIRVHAGREADEVTRSVNAKAFTLDREIFFRSGSYQPMSKTGQRLLAHELTHTIQQSHLTPTLQRQEEGAEEGQAAAGGGNMNLSDEGLQFIADHEGFRGELYNDAANHCTIGYGHLVHRGPCDGSESEEFQNGITQERGREILRQDAQNAVDAVNRHVQVNLNQAQFDTLVSFTFNSGVNAFANSTLLEEINNQNFDQVPDELRRWVHAGGERVQGLVNRREDEVDLFVNGEY